VHTWVLDVTRPDSRRTTIRTCRSARRQRMIRIAITAAAYEAIAATLPLGSVGFERELDANGQRLIWLAAAVVDRLAAMRGPGEDCSDVILRIAATGGRP
jgi:hypothetical protein